MAEKTVGVALNPTMIAEFRTRKATVPSQPETKSKWHGILSAESIKALRRYARRTGQKWLLDDLKRKQ